MENDVLLLLQLNFQQLLLFLQSSHLVFELFHLDLNVCADLCLISLLNKLFHLLAAKLYLVLQVFVCVFQVSLLGHEIFYLLLVDDGLVYLLF